MWGIVNENTVLVFGELPIRNNMEKLSVRNFS